MEKKLLYRFKKILDIFSDYELNLFLGEIELTKQHIIEQYPESANNTMRIEVFNNDIDGIEISLGYYRYETDEEYQNRITKPERDKANKLTRLYKEIDENTDEVIEHLKSMGIL